MTSDKFNKKEVITSKTVNVTKGFMDWVLKRKTEKFSIITKSNSEEIGSSSGNDGNVGFAKNLAGELEVLAKDIGKLFKKR